MADRSDLVYARSQAQKALDGVGNYGWAIEDGRTSDPAVATLLAAEAICTELRALGVTLEYCTDQAIKAGGAI